MKLQSKPMKTSTKVLLVGMAVFLVLLVVANFVLKGYFG